MTNMHNRINEYLSELEREKGITILLAVESGSRAYGFASENSDWDVRVIYTRDSDWYLSLNHNWDETFDRTTDDALDVCGWLLPKALKLMYTGNSAIHEWIHSSIVYKKNINFYAKMARLSGEYFSPLPAMWHYVELASGNYHRYIEDRNEYKLKRLLYVWRAMMVSKYVGKHLSFPGTKIDILVKGSSELGVPVMVQSKVNKLLTMKRSGAELGVGTWEEYSDLLDWLAFEINKTKDYLKNGNVLSNKMDIEPLNKTFRKFK